MNTFICQKAETATTQKCKTETDRQTEEQIYRKQLTIRPKLLTFTNMKMLMNIFAFHCFFWSLLCELLSYCYLLIIEIPHKHTVCICTTNAYGALVPHILLPISKYLIVSLPNLLLFYCSNIYELLPGQCFKRYDLKHPLL